MRGIKAVGLTCLMLLVSCGSSSSTAAISPVIAKVGSQVIRQSSLDLRLKAVLTSLSQGGAPTPKGKNDPMLEKVRANVLQGLITDAVIAQGVGELGALPPTDVDELAGLGRGRRIVVRVGERPEADH